MKNAYFEQWKKARQAREEAMEEARKEQEQLFKFYVQLRNEAKTNRLANWMHNTLFPNVMKQGKAVAEQEKANIDKDLYSRLTPEQKLLREKYKADDEAWKAFKENLKQSENVLNKKEFSFEGPNARDKWFQKNKQEGSLFTNKVLIDRLSESKQPISLTLNLTLDGIAKTYQMEFGEIGYTNGKKISASKRQQIINAGGAVAI